MKQIKSKIISITLVLSFSHVQAQIVPSSCTNHGAIYTWQTDADRLAIRRLFAINSPLKDSVRIDRQTSDSYLKCMLAVHNATSLPARDTIIYLTVHTKPEYDLQSMIFQTFNMRQSWVQNFRDSIFPTGYAKLDSLMDRYNLYKKSYYVFPGSGGDLATVKADSNFNVKALVKIFNTVVTQAQAPSINPPLGDYGNITDSIKPGYTELIYTYAWEDCPMRCMYRRSWRFRIYPNCDVEYMGSYGNSVQRHITIGISSHKSDQDGLKLYPNPVKDKLYVSSDIQAELINSLGQVIATVKGTEFDFEYLPAGIYYLKSKTGSVKFIKQK